MMITKSDKRDLKSIVATVTAAALLVTSPGPLATRAYAALASGASASGRAIPVTGGVAGVGATALNVSPSLAAPAVSLTLTPSLALPTVVAAVTPSRAPIAAAAARPVVGAVAAPVSSPNIAAAAPSAVMGPGLSIQGRLPAETAAPEAAKPATSQGALQRLVSDIAAAFRPGAAPKTEHAAASLNAAFDKNVRAEGASDVVSPASRGARAASGLMPAAAAVNECSGAGCGVPTPPSKTAPAAKPSAWQSPWVKFGVPALVIAGTGLFFHASLIPAAVISGSLMFSILAHESAHILGLRIWGDPSPKEAGRDHLNPFRHIDPFGTILLPAMSMAVSQAVLGFPILFGWAKPVPVDFNNLKDVQHDAAKVAALGPLTNAAIAALAFGAALALPALGLISAGGTAALLLGTLWKMNLALTLFNLLPLPWLDGGKLLVSVFSKSAYARWTANPNLPEGYQGLFRRIYEGPANILSRLNIKSLDRVNAITRVATLGALGAFYALFFSTLQFPLLFLALPCSYDYWCIREKVRSEEAVEEMMDLMSQWGAALVQIAEDHDANSEVSSFEAEHAMKNAVDQLLEDMMAKEDFRNLSDEEKIAAFMKAYPDMAVKFLKEKVFTQDSDDKIREVLADTRNAPFMARLEKWLKDHKVFEKMHSPHAKKKLKDSMKEADEKRSRGAGGSGMAAFAPLLLLPLAAAGVPGLEHLMGGALTPLIQLASALGLGAAVLGTLRRTPDGEGTDRAKLVVASNLQDSQRGSVYIHLAPGTPRAAAEGIVADVGGTLRETMRGLAGPGFEIRLEARDAVTAARKAVQASHHEEVTTVAIHRAAAGILRIGQSPAGDAGINPASAASEAVGAAPKWTRNATMASELEFWINLGTPVSNPTYEEQQAFLSRHQILVGNEMNVQSFEWINGYRLKVVARDWPSAERIIREADSDAPVTSISVHPDALNRLTLAAAVESTETAGRAAPEAEAAAPAGPEPMPGKVRADAAITERKTVRIEFAAGTTASEKKNFVDMHVRPRALRYSWEGNDLHVVLREMRYGAALASAAQAEDKAKWVAVSAAGLEALEGYRTSDPEAFDHSVANDATHSPLMGVDEARGVLLRLAQGADAEAVKAFADRFRLRLIEADYRGMAGLNLYEAADSDHPEWTLSTLSAALTADGPVASVTNIREEAAPAAAPAAVAEPKKAEAPAEAETPKRDAHAAWVNFLQTQVLADGKSTLTPKQVQLLSAFLKPVVPAAGQKKHPVIGRVDETKTVIPILTAPRGMINSTMLVGPAGTGKTAVFEGLAQLIEDAENSDAVKVEGENGSAWLDIRRLKGRWFVSLDIDRLLAEDEPIKILLAVLDLLPLLNDADSRKGNRIIILMDEIQKLRMDPQGAKIMNALKGPIRDGLISVAGTTTEKEWKEYFDNDDALKSRFEKINIGEPTVAETTEMLHGAKSYYEWKHEAGISDEALDAAAKLSDQFDKENHNPRKSVKLVEQSAELARPDNRRAELALEIREGWRRLGVAVAAAAKELAKKGIASAIALPVELYNKVAAIAEEVAANYAAQKQVADGQAQVDVDLIKKTLAKKTGISAGQLTLGEEDASRYVNMEDEVSKRVINQERAIRALANAIRRNKSGLSNPHRPMGKFLFVGPTGTGKTHLVKELARFLFKDPEAYVRFDMSEFMEEHTYMRLVGAPPSYVGFGQGGQLTEAVRKKPYSVILFDEVEKAHPKVWDVFLQILDDGRLTDSEGRTVDFKNTVIIMTSNVGMGAVDSTKYERLLQAQWEKLKALDDAADPAAAAARIEKALEPLRRSREAELKAMEARGEKAVAALRAASQEETDLLKAMKASQAIDAILQRAEAEYEAVASRHDQAIEAKRAALTSELASGGDALAARAKIDAEIEMIEKAWDEEIRLATEEGVKGRFRPEFINRLDEDPDSKAKWVIFNRLQKRNIAIIARLQLKEFVDLMRERQDTDIEVDDSVLDLLVEHGFSPVYGARPMQGAIEKFIVDPLAKWVLDMAQQGTTTRGKKIRVTVENGNTRFESVARPAAVIEKKALEGTAEELTREVMALVERRAAATLGQGPAAPEPTEKLFDGLLKKIAGEAVKPAAPAAAPVFNPGAAYPGGAGATASGEHNTAAKKDKALRAASDNAVLAARTAGAVPAVIDVLAPEAGQPGEGWVKQFVRHAKDMATKAGVETPVSLSYETAGGAVRVKVHSAHAMTDAEKEALRVHFTGQAPKDLKAAQQQADGVNLTGNVIRDHNLLDIYRRLSAIPGARFGYSSGAEGTDYWIELPLTGAAAAPRGSLPAAVKSELTPHEARERAKTKELFLKTLLSKNSNDNPNVRVAAASGWAMLATREDLATVRGWIVEKGWADRDSTTSRLTDNWPLLMAMALVMKRYGEVTDAAVLEHMLTLYSSSSHFHIPAKMALIDAVGDILARTDRAHARAVYEKAKEAGYNQTQLKEAAQRALAKIGVPADLDALADPELKEMAPDAFIEFLERTDPERLRAFFEAHWPAQPGSDGKLASAPFKGWDAKKKITILKLVGKGYGRPERDIELLKEVLNGTLNSDRVTHYHAAEAYAQIAARHNLGRNLQRQLEEFLEKHDFKGYDDKWPVLMAFLYTAQKIGGPELLGALEAAMKKDAGSLSSNYEQPFFELPITWAKVAVRSGKFAEFMRPEPGPDGVMGLSKIQKMLVSKDPMITAAALYAIALAQQQLGGHNQEADLEVRPDLPPSGDLPILYVPGSSSSGGSGYPYYMGMGLGGMHQHGDYDSFGPGRRGWHPANRLPPMM